MTWRLGAGYTGLPNPKLAAEAELKPDKRSKSKSKAQKRIDEALALPRLAELHWMRDFVRDATGDSRLNVWEANFVNSMKYWIAPGGPGVERLTQKQRDVIAKLAVKIDQPLLEDDPEPDPDAFAKNDEEPFGAPLVPAWDDDLL